MGDGPPQHIHNAEEEAFYVLEGDVNIQIGNAGSTPAKLLVIFSPPGFEQFFVEVVGDEEIDTATFVERGMAAAQKYNLEIVGPPLG